MLYFPLNSVCHGSQRHLTTLIKEVIVRRCSLEKMFLEILQNSQETTCTRVPFLIKLQACARVSFLTKLPATLLKKRLWHGCFPVNFAKYLRTPFLTKHFWWLLLELHLILSHWSRNRSKISNLHCNKTVLNLL